MKSNDKDQTPAIEFRNVCLSFGDDPILTDISFTLAQGEMLFLTGISGFWQICTSSFSNGSAEARLGTDFD